jgi:YegS/Rv2252/BmrU family lipid kinase
LKTGEDMKALVVLNPAADVATKRTVLETVGRHFDAVPMSHRVVGAGGRERLSAVMRESLLGGVDLVVAAGGDGTVSAVADGLVGRSIPFGIIPLGTGNLVARELDIPQDLEAAVALIAGAHGTKKIDAMRIGTRTFVLNAGVGIGASVVSGTTRRSKGRFGRVAYVATALSMVVSSRPRRLVVEVDGVAHSYRAVDVAIMNCGLLSRLLYPKGPDIRIDDGHLGVWILSMRTMWDYARYAAGLVAGRAAHPDAIYLRAEKSIAIRSNVPMQLQADGDIIGTTPVTVEVLPGALTVLVPREAG